MNLRSVFPILRWIISAGAIMILTLAVYRGALRNEFVNWDDDIYLYELPQIEPLTVDNVVWMFTHTYYYAWIPITLLSHAVDVHVWGFNPKGHHLTSIAIHGANAFWVFLLTTVFLLRKEGTGGSSVGSFVSRLTPPVILGSATAALLFSLHPLRVESVAWVSGRKDLLCAFFLLPATLSYFFSRVSAKGAVLWYLIALMLFVLAVLSKPIAIMAPFVLILIDAWFFDRERERSQGVRIKEMIPFLIVAGGAGMMTMSAASESSVSAVKDLTLGEQLLFPFYCVAFYIGKLLVPTKLFPVYPEADQIIVLASPVIALVITAVCVILFKRNQKWWLLAWLSYILFLLPTLFGLFSGMQPLADRYTYVSTIGLFILSGGVVQWVWRRTQGIRSGQVALVAVLGCVFIVAGLYGYKTMKQVKVWAASETLWGYVAAHSPESADVYKSIDLRLKPDYIDVLINLGHAYYTGGAVDEAVRTFEKALRLDPASADASYNLGNVLYERGNVERALALFRKTIELDDSYAKAYYNLGVIHAEKSGIDNAIVFFQNAARLGYHPAQEILRQNGYGW